MNSKVFMVLRILFGLMLLVFGLNKFFNFLPAPEGLSEAAGAYFGAIVSTKTFLLVGLVEVLTGLALILNKFGALMSVILMSVSVNIVLFHITLDPEGIGPGLAVFILNILMLYGYKDTYKGLLSA